jgi:hypothetical protein
VWFVTTRLAKFHHTKQKNSAQNNENTRKTRKRTFFFHDPDQVHAQNSAPCILTPLVCVVPDIGSIRRESKVLLPNGLKKSISPWRFPRS